MGEEGFLRGTLDRVLRSVVSSASKADRMRFALKAKRSSVEGSVKITKESGNDKALAT